MVPSKEPMENIIVDEETDSFQKDFEAKLPDKKDSWITYDSGIDLTLKDGSSFTCSVEDKSELYSQASGGDAPSEGRIRNFFDRYFRQPRRALISGNLINSFAVSNLELNVEELLVVERVTIL
eukprot:gene12975-3739_t